MTVKKKREQPGSCSLAKDIMEKQKKPIYNCNKIFKGSKSNWDSIPVALFLVFKHISGFLPGSRIGQRAADHDPSGYQDSIPAKELGEQRARSLKRLLAHLACSLSSFFYAGKNQSDKSATLWSLPARLFFARGWRGNVILALGRDLMKYVFCEGVYCLENLPRKRIRKGLLYRGGTE